MSQTQPKYLKAQKIKMQITPNPKTLQLKKKTLKHKPYKITLSKQPQTINK
jgi:hypothetical protein